MNQERNLNPDNITIANSILNALESDNKQLRIQWVIYLLNIIDPNNRELSSTLLKILGNKLTTLQRPVRKIYLP